MGNRREEEFVPVNCGAIPEHLLESEFFGHKKGAFTGAYADKHGYLDLADKGSLFLDEIGERGMNIQVKLLRFLEGGGYSPLGSAQIQHSDIRIGSHLSPYKNNSPPDRTAIFLIYYKYL